MTAIYILIIIVCILLITIVLIQNPKGGGLASGITSSNQIIGVKKQGDILEKATWTLAILLVVLSLVASSLDQTNAPVETESEIQKEIGDAPLQTVPQPNPQAAPQTTPAN